MNKKLLKSALVPMLTLSVLIMPVSAKAQFFNRMDTSVSILDGRGYALKGDHVTSMKVENSNGWVYGDFYGLLRLEKRHDRAPNDEAWLLKLRPRFSLDRITGHAPRDGFIRDILVAVEYFEAKAGTRAALIGPGLSLRVPGFAYLNLNVMARKELEPVSGDDMQVSWSWRVPFRIGRFHFWTDGFGDYIAGWGPQADNLHIISQTKLDLGAFSDRPGRLFLGVELDYWQNQFGVQNRPGLDSNSFAAALILRAHF